MSRRYCLVTHSAMHAHFRAANVFERKQICRLIHPRIPAAEIVIFITIIEDELCDGDPVRGPAKCRLFDDVRKSKEKEFVLHENKYVSEARTEVAVDHSYKLTAALASASGVLPDGAVAAIVPQGNVA
jgi:hypothetical protein